MPNKQEITDFLQQEFPQNTCEIVSIADGETVMVQQVDNRHLRPGGTVSGPTMMAVADMALYVAILAEIGIVPLAVTTSLNINFLRRPRAGAAIEARCRLLKLGKRLAVGEVGIYSCGDDDPVAHATGTYAIPPR